MKDTAKVFSVDRRAQLLTAYRPLQSSQQVHGGGGEKSASSFSDRISGIERAIGAAATQENLNIASSYANLITMGKSEIIRDNVSLCYKLIHT